MKKLISLLFLGLALQFFSFDLLAQLVKYDTLKTIDGVEFSYRWVREKRFDKNSSQALSLSVLNTNAKKITVSFGLEYFWKLQHHGDSEIRTFCLFPNERYVGRLDDLVYSIPGLTDSELKSDDFSWNLSNLKIEQVENCDKLLFDKGSKEPPK